MSSVREERKEKKAAVGPAAAFSWQERKELADKEQEALEKEIRDLKAWTEMIDAMNDEQLKDYLKNRPDEMKSVKIHKTKPNRPRVQHVRKSRTSASAGIMASVWKFHKDDGDGCPTNLMLEDNRYYFESVKH